MSRVSQRALLEDLAVAIDLERDEAVRREET